MYSAVTSLFEVCCDKFIWRGGALSMSPAEAVCETKVGVNRAPLAAVGCLVYRLMGGLAANFPRSSLQLQLATADNVYSSAINLLCRDILVTVTRIL